MEINYNDILTREGVVGSQAQCTVSVYSLETVHSAVLSAGLCYQFTSMCNDWSYYYR